MGLSPDSGLPPAPPSTPSPDTRQGRPRRWFHLDSYAIAACVMFVVTFVCCWESSVQQDEEIYFLGPRHLADPTFLARDFTWSKLSPTSALFDHLVAPLFLFLDAFTIANIGRLVFWILMVWSVVRLARTIRIPAWATATGFAVWVLWGQTLGICGTPLEGFQVKSFAYPLMFFALAFAMRGQVVRAGLAAGLGTAFHIVVGGWALLALTLSMLINRRLFSFRQVFVFLLASVPFVVPLLVSVAVFHGGHATPAEQAWMDATYVMFAMPHCCDVFYFLSSKLSPFGWVRAGVIFVVAPIVVFSWPQRREARILSVFTVALIAFFALGVLGRSLGLNGLLKLFPYQLGNALPALFLFMFVAGWIGIGGATRAMGKLLWPLAIVGTLWLMYDRGVATAVVEQTQFFIDKVRVLLVLGPDVEEPVFTWIRERTPRNSVFITPLINEFWPYGERAQVASMRQPPLDRRLIEWKERLEAINGFQPFTQRGWGISNELALHESQLSIPQLIRIRDRYGATHYMLKGERKDLAAHLLRAESGYSIYDLAGLAPEDATH